tara:strand:+ start:1428 stop:2111 length:684 start_codon:yes stop_codon:yes gene_type:complete
MSKQLSITEVMSRVGLSGTQVDYAYRSLADCMSEEDGLPLMFNSTSMTAVDGHCETEAAGPDESIRLLLCTGDPIEISGEVRLIDPFFVRNAESYKYYARHLIAQDKPYSACDETGMFADYLQVDIESAFVLEADLDDYIRAHGSFKKTLSAEPGLSKALALLAREKAESSPKFRTGDKVNASAFRNHVISLAKKYDIPTGKLSSLDDKLNKILNELDLKEIQQSED